MSDYKIVATRPPKGVSQENWDLAAHDASLGVGHCWFRLECPAYCTFRPSDCTCGTV